MGLAYNIIKEAIRQAEKSPVSTQYGAVLIYRNKIISTGYNNYKLPIFTKLKSCLL